VIGEAVVERAPGSEPGDDRAALAPVIEPAGEDDLAVRLEREPVDLLVRVTEVRRVVCTSP